MNALPEVMRDLTLLLEEEETQPAKPIKLIIKLFGWYILQGHLTDLNWAFDLKATKRTDSGNLVTEFLIKQLKHIVLAVFEQKTRDLSAFFLLYSAFSVKLTHQTRLNILSEFLDMALQDLEIMDLLVENLLENSLEDLKLMLSLLTQKCEEEEPPVEGILCILLMLPSPHQVQADLSLQKQCSKLIRIACLKLARVPQFQTCLLGFVANAPQKLFPKIDRPQLLADVFVRGFTSVKENVELAVQSLSGLFVLITQYGLEYPGYYQKLYEFTEPTILRKTLQCEGKKVFLKLMRTSLLSEDIPIMVVASFVKRLVRFCVEDGSISGTLFALRLAAELLVAHPPVRCLIHQNHSDLRQTDCFKSFEKNPLTTSALSCQLWELQVLSKHHHPAVCAGVKIFSSALDSPSTGEELVQTEKVAQLGSRDILRRDLKEVRKLG